MAVHGIIVLKTAKGDVVDIPTRAQRYNGARITVREWLFAHGQQTAEFTVWNPQRGTFINGASDYSETEVSK
jgi:hypothetical protein